MNHAGGRRGHLAFQAMNIEVEEEQVSADEEDEVDYSFRFS